MENLQENFTAALTQARELPTHINGKLQNSRTFFGDDKIYSKVIYNNNISPVDIFEALKPKYTEATRFYIKSIPTRSKNGNLKSMASWDKKLMFHKAWARTDIEVKEVTFDIVGIKRKTTYLPAGVLISNIKFIK